MEYSAASFALPYQEAADPLTGGSRHRDSGEIRVKQLMDQIANAELKSTTRKNQ